LAGETERFLEAKIGAQRRATWIQLAALAGAAVCIAAAASMQNSINQQRKDLKLVVSSNIYKELPPKYAWITAAGGTFRGIATDILWARAEDLKNEGKYYESHQLAKWICTLQPRFPQVWVFQAWNMSYNISVATHTPRERWQWVYNGIRLLRDEGIPNNERSMQLYHELAWIWSHKVGKWADDFHWIYKREWAAAMETLLGQPPAGLSNAETIDWFRPVAEAPASLDKLIAARPGVQKIVDDLTALGVDVEAGTRIDRVFHPLEEKLFKPYTAWRIDKQYAGIRTAASEREVEEDNPDAKLRALFAEAPPEDLDALLAWLRAKVLREQYKMDPGYMLDLTGELGTDEPIPIDWRTPWSQAIYWAKYGVERSAGMKTAETIDILNTDRILLHSLWNIALQGLFRFQIDLDSPADSYLNTGPDVRYIEAMHRMYLALGKKHAEEGEEIGDTAGETLRSGHVNNLRAAIKNLYFAGKREEAQRYMEYLAINYKDMLTKETETRYLEGLDAFVLGELKDTFDSFDETTATIESLLESGYLDLAAGWLDRYIASIRNAGTVYEAYQKEHLDDRQGRLTLQPFADLRANALSRFVTNPNHPLLYRSIAWNREQAEVKQRCYDLTLPFLRQQCDAAGIDLARAFPEPPGMEQFRKEHPGLKSPEAVAEETRKKDQESRKR